MLFGCYTSQNKIVIIDDQHKTVATVKTFTNLQVYVPDTLLADLLNALVISNKQNYPSDRSFYLLIWGKARRHRQLTIINALCDAPQKGDYNGIIMVDDMSFLLVGDIHRDTAFFKKERNKKIKISIAKGEEDTIPLPIEPILQGTLANGPKPPIYVEVYAKSAIIGYEMMMNGRKLKY